MNTQVAMDYLDADKAKFERGGTCFTTIPDLEVVVEKHYAWSLPVIVGGIATNNGGVPWGFLASVNDVFKSSNADQDQGPIHAAHMDADLLGGGFTYTSIHELSHFLGLAHPHDTIGESRVDTNGDGTPDTTEYWNGFLWTFDSTAAPTTYAFDQMRYAVLDQENIARGHLAYYLKWTREALKEAGAPLSQSDHATDALSAPEANRQTAIVDGDSAAVRRVRLRLATFAAQKMAVGCRVSMLLPDSRPGRPTRTDLVGGPARSASS